MIDHLIRCADMDEWAAVREQYALHDGNSHYARVYTIGSATDPETGQATAVREYLPYDYVWASLPQLSEAIRNDARCMIVADAEAAERGAAFVLQCALPPEEFAQYFVEPVRMGSRYPFGQVG